MKLLQKYFLLAALVATCLPLQAQNVIGFKGAELLIFIPSVKV